MICSAKNEKCAGVAVEIPKYGGGKFEIGLSGRAAADTSCEFHGGHPERAMAYYRNILVERI